MRVQLSAALLYQASSFLASESGDLSQATRYAEVAFGILKKISKVKRSRHHRSQVESWILSTVSNQISRVFNVVACEPMLRNIRRNLQATRFRC